MTGYTFKKDKDVGYYILRQDGTIVGSVREDRYGGKRCWVAFGGYAPEKKYPSAVVIRGAKTRKAAVWALTMVLSSWGGVEKIPR